MGPNPCFATDGLLAVLAAAAGDEEACGLLLGEERRVAIERARNVSPTPRTTFEIDPAALLAAHRAARAGGAAVLGCWHTHPTGDPRPSARDARDAAPDGRLWLIASPTEARLWRARAAGAVHGRFDPVPFDVAAPLGEGTDPTCVEMAVLAVQGSSAGLGSIIVSGPGSTA